MCKRPVAPSTHRRVVVVGSVAVRRTATNSRPLSSHEPVTSKVHIRLGSKNSLRPARMGLSVAISPWTDKIVEFFRQYVPGKKKPLAFALTVFCVNVLGTFAYMFGGFFLINALTGVPLEVGSLKSLLVAGKAEVAAQGMAAK